MLIRLGRWAQGLISSNPWTNVYGLTRSLLALGTLGTLALNSSQILFHPVAGAGAGAGAGAPPYCEGVAVISLFCLLPLEVARGFAAAALVIIASGWRPRWTALPHWWVAFSLQVSATITDGGDQVTSVLALLLLPVALTDSRRWQWELPLNGKPMRPGEELRRVIAHLALLAVRLQVASLYFHAAVGKLKTEEWVDGTGMYYWLLDSTFGVPGPVRPIASWLLSFPIVVALLTWGVLALEFALASGLILPMSTRRRLLFAGIVLHTGIAALMGLMSFSLAMIASLLVYLCPVSQPFPQPTLQRPSIGRPQPASLHETS
jgi:antimicrobial peptide system SdpB family protein